MQKFQSRPAHLILPRLLLPRLGLIFALLGVACSQTPSGTEQRPLVLSTQRKVLSSTQPSFTPGVAHSNSLGISITVDREALLNQEFLFGADLQYSSLFDSSMNLYNQSMAIGHIPARFRISGNELQLVADNKRLYPSDVNHPELLLSRYKILKQTPISSKNKIATLTVSGAESGPVLAQLFAATSETNGLLKATEPPPRTSWIRSFDFIPQGNYLLQQTSIVLSDGSTAEMMESVFPRSTLSPGKSFEKFAMKPDDPIGASSGPAFRFRMLPGEKIFEGENAVSYAQHFDPSNGTIDFYVTPNIPDASLEPVRLAVEGWNRYFNSFSNSPNGLKRNLLRFVGKLPAGIYLGDPRYNVISWDSRRVAGAAYETQATDPSTGVQSHSLIYLPAAWLQIGQDYWTDGQFTDGPSSLLTPVTSGPTVGTSSSRLKCDRDMREIFELAHSGRLSKNEVEDFATQTLKQTLFHEVGHSLGLAHNFKGSLSYDRSKPSSIFSTSIMDYNDYEIERKAFYDTQSADGPLLEYDRQALSAIYNHSADIQNNDPMVPVCNDEEADTDTDGVDPLCIRYDIEKDPTLSITTALNRVNSKILPNDVSLPDAILHVWDIFQTDKDKVQNIKTSKDLESYVSKIRTSIEGSIRFYVLTGKASVAKSVVANLKSLLVFKDQILPLGYNETEMRDRAFLGVKLASEMNHLPLVLSESVVQAAAAALITLKTSPYIQSLTPEDQTTTMESARIGISRAVYEFENDETHGLPSLRTKVLTALARNKKIPYFLGSLPLAATDPISGGTYYGKYDFELAASTLLFNAIVDLNRTESERIAAAKSLSTFQGRMDAEDLLLTKAKESLQKEKLSATTNKARETAIKILASLDPA